MYRVGLGHDTHRLVEGNSLHLGGIVIPFHKTLLGHSDADPLLHAICDALLGAAALGDIGDYFPDTSEENRGRDSAEILAICIEMVAQEGWSVENLDCYILAQEPKLGALKGKMRDRIASILDVNSSCVCVKAKTGEHVGPVGRGEAITAVASVILTK
ncbi:MAG: 2-C-methyl-D-erythritol 2,4-cyclodiphosphate synthase [Planctomycetia bacterium]|nr:2-C-methyl-D-erythritol 2,4-cyclodiphosphate synthase [Planctomycetia bacterium]